MHCYVICILPKRRDVSGCISLMHKRFPEGEARGKNFQESGNLLRIRKSLGCLGCTTLCLGIYSVHCKPLPLSYDALVTGLLETINSPTWCYCSILGRLCGTPVQQVSISTAIQILFRFVISLLSINFGQHIDQLRNLSLIIVTLSPPIIMILSHDSLKHYQGIGESSHVQLKCLTSLQMKGNLQLSPSTVKQDFFSFNQIIILE